MGQQESNEEFDASFHTNIHDQYGKPHQSKRNYSRWINVSLDILSNKEFLISQHQQLIGSNVNNSSKERIDNSTDIDHKTTISHIFVNERYSFYNNMRRQFTERSNSNLSKKECNISSLNSYQMTDVEEIELMNSIIQLGGLQQHEQTALLTHQLNSQLFSEAVYQHPIYNIIDLKRYIFRQICQANIAYHRQLEALEELNQKSLQIIRAHVSSNGINLISKSKINIDGLQNTMCLNSGRKTVYPTTTPKQLIMNGHKTNSSYEALVGFNSATSILDAIDDSSIHANDLKREMLRDLCALIDDLQPLSLMPQEIGQLLVQQRATRLTSPIVAAQEQTKSLLQQMQKFLLHISKIPTTNENKVKSTVTIQDQTTAMRGQLRLAVSSGSLSDMLIFLISLIGASNKGVETVAHTPCLEISKLLGQKTMYDGEEQAPYLDINTRGSGDCVKSKMLNKQNVKHNQPGCKAHQVFPRTVTASLPEYSCTNATSLSHLTHLQNVLKSDNFEFSNLYLFCNCPAMRAVGTTNKVTTKCPDFPDLCVATILREVDQLEPSYLQTEINLRNNKMYKIQGAIHANMNPDSNLLELSSTIWKSYAVFPIARDQEASEVWSCGQNAYGELGHGDTTPRKSFENILSLHQKNIIAICAGNEHSIALSGSGSLYTCGYNDNGQCGQGSSARIANMTEIPYQFIPKLLTEEGSEVSSEENTVESRIHVFSQVHAYNGCEHSIAITADGKVATCGYNYRGQLGHSTTTSELTLKFIYSLFQRVVRNVSCSYYHTVLTCEDNDHGGASVTYSFGRNDYGQLGLGDTVDRKSPTEIEYLTQIGANVISIACGQYHTMIVCNTANTKSNNIVLGFGKNDYGQLGIEDDMSCGLPVNTQQLPVRLRNDLLEKHEAIEVRCGYYHTIVLCKNSYIIAFGRNDYGQLGLNQPNGSSHTSRQLRYSIPQLINDLVGKSITKISCGCYHTITAAEDGMLYVFGRNNHGQLGTGDTDERFLPFPIDDFLGKRIAMIATGFYHSLVLTGGQQNSHISKANGVSNESIVGIENSLGIDLSTNNTGNYLISSKFTGDTIRSENAKLWDYSLVLESKVAQMLMNASTDGSTLSINMPVQPLTPSSHRKSNLKGLICQLRERRYTDPRPKESNLDPKDEINSQLNRQPIIEDEQRKMHNIPSYERTNEAMESSFFSNSDSVNIAIVLLAQLDRLSHPQIEKISLAPTKLQQPTQQIIDYLMYSDTCGKKSHGSNFGLRKADLSNIFEYSFQPFTVHVCSSTLNSLQTLLMYLGAETLSTLSKSAQNYMLTVCLRLLQLNLHHLLSSGLGKAVTLFTQSFHDCHVSATATDKKPQNSSKQKASPVYSDTTTSHDGDELQKIYDALCQLRHTLFYLIDVYTIPLYGLCKPSPRIHEEREENYQEPDHFAIKLVVSEAVTALMHGFDVFFPCICTQSNFIMTAISSYISPDMHTLFVNHLSPLTPAFPIQDNEFNFAENTARVGIIHAHQDKMVGRSVLLAPLLRRVTENDIIAKWLLLESNPYISQRLLPEKHTAITALLHIEEIYIAVMTVIHKYTLNVLHSEIGSIHRQGSAFQSYTLSLIETSFLFLSEVLKHAATAAASCPRWDRPYQDEGNYIKLAHSKTCSYCEIEHGEIEHGDIYSRLSSIVCQTFRVDAVEIPDTSIGSNTRVPLTNPVGLPISWHQYLRFSVLIVHACCEILEITQLLLSNNYQQNNQLLSSNLVNITDVLKNTTLGKVLPQLLSGLSMFSGNPLFAATMLPNLKILFRLFDNVNRAILATGIVDGKNQQYCYHELRHISTFDSDLNTSTLGSEVFEEMRLPWTLLLQKELAIITSDMAITLVIGKPMFCLEFDKKQTTEYTRNNNTVDDCCSSESWLSSPLFKGGLASDILRTPIENMYNAETCAVHSKSDTTAQWVPTQLVPHSPYQYNYEVTCIEDSPKTYQWRINSWVLPRFSAQQAPFSLMLPPSNCDLHDITCFTHNEGSHHLSQSASLYESYVKLCSAKNCILFLREMAGVMKSKSEHNFHSDILCQWIRSNYALTDPSYRIIIHQSKPQTLINNTTTGLQLTIEMKLENCLFAALIHHHGLRYHVFHIAIHLSKYLQGTGEVQKPRTPPFSLLRLWRVVAQFRRHISNQVMEIKNLENRIDLKAITNENCQTTPAEYALPRNTLRHLYKGFRDRSQLLVLLQIDDDVEHNRFEGDSGFIAPCNSAISFCESAYYDTSDSDISIKKHFATTYTSSKLPFLVAYPQSCWKRIRILIHVTARWKRLTFYPFNGVHIHSKPTPFNTHHVSERASEIFSFVTSKSNVTTNEHLHQLLVDPCRRLAYSVRGLQTLQSILEMTDFNCMHVAIIQRITASHIFKYQIPIVSGTSRQKAMALDSEKSIPLASLNESAGRFFCITWHNTLCEFLTTTINVAAVQAHYLAKALSQKSPNLALTSFVSQKSPQKPSNVSSIPSDTNNKLLSLLTLLKCWCICFQANNYEFVNDSGILSILQQLMAYLSQLKVSTASDTTLSNSNTVTKVLTEIWRVFQHIVVAFSARNENTCKTIPQLNLPTYPSLCDSFDILYRQVHVTMQTANIPLKFWEGMLQLHSPTLTNSEFIPQDCCLPEANIRRHSFDIVTAPIRVSPMHSGRFVHYNDMISSTTSSIGMRQVATSNEFSITSWVYINEYNKASIERMGNSPQKYLMFVRGSQRKFSIFVVLAAKNDGYIIEIICVSYHDHNNTSVSTAACYNDNDGKILQQPNWCRMQSQHLLYAKTWTHIAIISESCKFSLFVNGNLDSQHVIPFELSLNANDTKLTEGISTDVYIDLPIQIGQLKDNETGAPILSHQIVEIIYSNENASSKVTSIGETKSKTIQIEQQENSSISSFDGWICLFRYHSRPLTPIHVRIVLEDRQPLKLEWQPGTNAHLCELLALLHILSASSEGQLEFLSRGERWFRLLWQSFLDSDSFTVQQSALRTLGAILAVHMPSQVSSYFPKTFGKYKNAKLTQETSNNAVPFYHPNHIFANQILRIIGFCLSICSSGKSPDVYTSAMCKDIHHALNLPWQYCMPATVHNGHYHKALDDCGTLNEWDMFIASDTNSPKQNEFGKVEHNDNFSTSNTTSIANELIRLLEYLSTLSNITGKHWKESISTTILATLSQNVCSNSAQGKSTSILDTNIFFNMGNRLLSTSVLHELDTIGCLQFMTNVVQQIEPGCQVLLKHSNTPAKIVAIPRKINKFYFTELTRNNGDQRVFIYVPHSGQRQSNTCLQNENSMPHRSKASYSKWYSDVMNSYCQLSLLHSRSHINCGPASQTVQKSQFVLTHVDELEYINCTSGELDNQSVEDQHSKYREVLLRLAIAILPSVIVHFNSPDFSSMIEPQENNFGFEESVLRIRHIALLLLQQLYSFISKVSTVSNQMIPSKLFQTLLTLSTTCIVQESTHNLQMIHANFWKARAQLHGLLLSKERSNAAVLKSVSDLEPFNVSHCAFTEVKVEGDTSDSSLRVSRSSKYESVETISQDERSICNEESEHSNEFEVTDVESGIDHELEEGMDDETDIGEDGELQDPSDEEDEECNEELLEELMLMGFPEEWCALALKQAGNNIVSASSWVVDNLEYLTQLQTSVNISHGSPLHGNKYNEEEDDSIGEKSDLEYKEKLEECSDYLQSENLSEVCCGHTSNFHDGSKYLLETHNTQSNVRSVHDEIENIRTDVEDSPEQQNKNILKFADNNEMHCHNDNDEFFPPMLSDIELGRKVFGEMYFPLEEGGYGSNTNLFQLNNKDLVENMDIKSTLRINDDYIQTSNKIYKNDEDISTMDNDKLTESSKNSQLRKALQHLQKCENALAVTQTRKIMLTLVFQYSKNLTAISESIQHPPLTINTFFSSYFLLLKLSLFRGDQLAYILRSPDKSKYLPAEAVAEETIGYFLANSTYGMEFQEELMNFCFNELELAACDRQYDAILWTQRDLTRCDRKVISEPAVELVEWMLHITLKNGSCMWLTQISYDKFAGLIKRLRYFLRTNNLPLKALLIRIISKILYVLWDDAEQNKDLTLQLKMVKIVQDCKLDEKDFRRAVESRVARERMQNRLLYSLYVQTYVELLHILRLITKYHESNLGVLNPDSLPRPFLSNVASEGSSRSSMKFELKHCVRGCLSLSDDGSCVSYLGNEVWKTVVATTSFAVGQHAWEIKVEKSTSSYLFIGVAEVGKVNSDGFLGGDEHSWGFIGDRALYYNRERMKTYGEKFVEGDIIRVELDCDQGTLSFSKNNDSLGIAFNNVVGRVAPAISFYSRYQRVKIHKCSPATKETKYLQNWCQEYSNCNTNDYAVPGHESSIDECLLVCELMDSMSKKKRLQEPLLRFVYEKTIEWVSGTIMYSTTRSGDSIWLDIRVETCAKLGFQPQQRVQTSRGPGTVLGVDQHRVWVDIDRESGVWHFHPDRLSSIDPINKNSSASQARISKDQYEPPDGRQDEVDMLTYGENAIASNSSTSNGTSNLSFSEFTQLHTDKSWSLTMYQEIINVINDHCEQTNTSPWNISPDKLLDLIKSKNVGALCKLDWSRSMKPYGFNYQEKLIIAQTGILRLLNAYFCKAITYFDCTWQYFSLINAVSPVRQLAKFNGCIFVNIKNTFIDSLLKKTSISPRESDDDYDYPEDLTILSISRPKAAAAISKTSNDDSNILDSMFGQAFSELHFLPVSKLRMIYTHPMDDGQLRSFKVKFEGEGVDDYGGPYREFFSQMFAELQTIDTSYIDTNTSRPEKLTLNHSTRSLKCILPLLLPSPNWRNNVGDNREKLVLNGALIAEHDKNHYCTEDDRSQECYPNSESNAFTQAFTQEKRQLYQAMYYFLGQMLGMCIRSRVCIRLDIATSIWREIVQDNVDDVDPNNLDNESTHVVLDMLKEVDYVAYSLWTMLKSLCDEWHQLTAHIEMNKVDINTVSNKRRLQNLEEQLNAMDLTFITHLSDGRCVELIDKGNHKAVTMENIKEYLYLMLRSRHQEHNGIVKLIREGLASILPVTVLQLLTWQELERRVCGESEVNIKLLQDNTEYDDELLPNDEVVLRFWRVIESMDQKDRRAFLRFVWARSRLPVGISQFHQKFKIQILNGNGMNGENEAIHENGNTVISKSSSWMDKQLPKSHTCFFALQLPRYSSDEICRKQLLYAIHNCTEMDGDFRLADSEMTSWAEINPSDTILFQ